MFRFYDLKIGLVSMTLETRLDYQVQIVENTKLEL